MGLIIADGCISERGWQINLRDRQILDDVASWLNMKNCVKEYRNSHNCKSNNPRYNLSARSKYFVDRLRYYGVTEKKTGAEDYRNIPDDYYSDFIRDFMDGDGNISQGSIRLYSSKFMIHKISDDLKRIYGYNCGINYHSSIIYCLRIRAQDSKDLTRRMYEKPHLSLRRKEVILCQKYFPQWITKDSKLMLSTD